MPEQARKRWRFRLLKPAAQAPSQKKERKKKKKRNHCASELLCSQLTCHLQLDCQILDN